MIRRRQPVGAEILPDGRVHFRVWAPKHREVEVVLENAAGGPASLGLKPEAKVTLPGAVAGRRQVHCYRFRLGGCDGERSARSGIPVPTRGTMRAIRGDDPSCFRWTDQGWQGIVSIEGQVLYELHIGTFTPQGTWAAALPQLPVSCRTWCERSRDHADCGVSRPVWLGL